MKASFFYLACTAISIGMVEATRLEINQSKDAISLAQCQTEYFDCAAIAHVACLDTKGL